MATKIQTRANEAYPVSDYFPNDNDIKNYQFHAYIKGATEQREIDIEKACNAHCRTCGVNCAPEDREDCGEYCNFLKVLLEE